MHGYIIDNITHDIRLSFQKQATYAQHSATTTSDIAVGGNRCHT